MEVERSKEILEKVQRKEQDSAQGQVTQDPKCGGQLAVQAVRGSEM